jgi:hypothetical protein
MNGLIAPLAPVGSRKIDQLERASGANLAGVIRV